MIQIAALSPSANPVKFIFSSIKKNLIISIFFLSFINCSIFKHVANDTRENLRFRHLRFLNMFDKKRHFIISKYPYTNLRAVTLVLIHQLFNKIPQIYKNNIKNKRKK
ncbi:hypothetical protein BpHYR1_014268 [Brachionus plicatilis]|uniref:Uncharacterized protein n=1 Tax=Brachionus plicatilis TaxID=10195 RepID=A0A3M7SVQ0_BRAPC|nr:hypothetical protein BpHYR1_014268 [Brachionus plicatilis]